MSARSIVVRTVPASIMLIKGQRLADLLVEHGGGVQARRRTRIDEIHEEFVT